MPGHVSFGDHVALCNYDEKDGAFIASARTDVPALVARVRELEAEKASLKELVESHGVSIAELRARRRELQDENERLKHELNDAHAHIRGLESEARS
jgi:septal ring factor EnvC (AmiA/AmiB activator)